MDKQVVFSISTQLEMEGRQLKAVKPDKNGVYKGIPLTVIGVASRNHVDYDRASTLNCITNLQGRFAANVQSGDMEGEWGHPLIATKEDLPRLLYIDRARVSHYFTNVYGVETDNAIIVYGDVVPYGPFGQYLKESFEDPKRNTSFSLRSAARVIGQSGANVKKQMLALVTFDAVDGPGFLHASKRFRDPNVATESLDINVTKNDYISAMSSLQSVGHESIITDQQVLDAFGCDQVKVKDIIMTKAGKGRFVSDQGSVSIFGEMFDHK